MSDLQWYSVHSSVVEAIAWDPDGFIRVEFKTGVRYRYEADKGVFEDMMRSHSMGAFVNEVLNKLPYEKES